MDRPILFSAPMVRAILDGRKTQTRRVMKPQPFHVEPSCGKAPGLVRWRETDVCMETWGDACPYGQSGDRLWVRETWVAPYGPLGQVYYKADQDRTHTDEGILLQWRSSRFMFRWASRLTLEIVSVRPERLQEISPRDAYAEGAIPEHDPIPVGATWDDTVGSVAVPAFRNLWDSINGKRYPWASNPWVWRIEFKKVRP